MLIKCTNFNCFVLFINWGFLEAWFLLILRLWLGSTVETILLWATVFFLASGPRFIVVDELLLFSFGFEGQQQINFKLIFALVLSYTGGTYCIIALYWISKFISFLCTSGGSFSKMRSILFILQLCYIILNPHYAVVAYWLINDQPR